MQRSDIEEGGGCCKYNIMQRHIVHCHCVTRESRAPFLAHVMRSVEKKDTARVDAVSFKPGISRSKREDDKVSV
jgi:hypothetical protein